MIERLGWELIRAELPVASCSGTQGNVVVTYHYTLSAAQQALADSIINGFNWTQAAHDDWLARLDLDRRCVAASVPALQDSTGKLLRALAAVIIDELNILRGVVIGEATTTFDPANMANGTGTTSPAVAVVGAAFGDVVDVAAPYSLQGVVAVGYVSSAGNVQVRLHNSTGGAVNLASGTWKVVVRRQGVLNNRTATQAKQAIMSKIESGME